MRTLVMSVLITLDQELSENIWVVWSKTSFIGDVTDAGQTNKQQQGKTELLSF